MSEHPKFLLRWCFEFVNKPKKYGMWSHPGEFDTEKAWCQNKDGLTNAVIEGKNFLTREVIPLASVAGPDFVNFQWIAAGVQRGMKVAGSKTIPYKIVGLMLITRDKKLKVYESGQAEVEEHNIDYGRINLAGFGR